MTAPPSWTASEIAAEKRDRDQRRSRLALKQSICGLDDEERLELDHLIDIELIANHLEGHYRAKHRG